MPDNYATLGTKPITINVSLSRGADFVALMRRKSGDWEPGTEISLHFGETIWLASIDGDTASWDVDKADVDALIEARATTVQTRYTDDDRDALWAEGWVIVNG